MTAILFAMLIASINYGNNMAYILCFLLTGLFLVTYLYTRYNLKGLDIINIMPQPAFAGDIINFKLELANHTTNNHFGIWLTNGKRKSTQDFSGPYLIGSQETITAKISFISKKRGRFNLSRIELTSLYPLGLFVSQKQIKVNAIYLIYPRPEGTSPWPEPESHSYEKGEGYHHKGGDDFTGVRPYRPGEPQHHIDWKAVARGRPLSIKEFTGGGSAHLCFDWKYLQGQGTESRLSQLCKWVLEADELGIEFALKLPEVKIGTGSGSNHLLKCLEALAIFGSNQYK
jgi:uncharacterized protein (DUF58 family)